MPLTAITEVAPESDKPVTETRAHIQVVEAIIADIHQSRMAALNIEFLKHCASCSKIERHNDKIRGGFMTNHQILNGNMFKSFDIEVNISPS